MTFKYHQDGQYDFSHIWSEHRDALFPWVSSKLRRNQISPEMSNITDEEQRDPS